MYFYGNTLAYFFLLRMIFRQVYTDEGVVSTIVLRELLVDVVYRSLPNKKLGAPF